MRSTLKSFRGRAAVLAISGLVVGGGVLGVIGTTSPVNASPIAHPFDVPVAVPNANAGAALSKLLARTRAAGTAQLDLNVFVRITGFNGPESLSWGGSGVAGFKPDRAAVSYQGLFYKILASSQAVIVNSKLYVHRVGLTTEPAAFGLNSSLTASSSSGKQWLEGPLPDGPLGVATGNFVSLLGDLPLMLAHGATVGKQAGEPGYVVTLPKSALIALYEAHGLSADTAKADVASLGHFVCEIAVANGFGSDRNKVSEIDFFLQSSSYGEHNEISVFASYGDYGISVSVVPPPKSEVRWAPNAADENLTI
jgi:hypothetical protein